MIPMKYLATLVLLISLSSSGEETVSPLPITRPVIQATVITLERIPFCSISCPSYEVTIYGDGTVHFMRRMFLDTEVEPPAEKPMIRVKSKISLEQLNDLISLFEKANYFSLRDRYESEEDGCPKVWTDYGSVFTSVTLNGKSKSIRHYSGCQESNSESAFPLELTKLEDKIDEIVGTKRWIE